MKCFQKWWNPGQVLRTVINVDEATFGRLILRYSKRVSLERTHCPENTRVVDSPFLPLNSALTHIWILVAQYNFYYISSHAILKWVKVNWGHISRRKSLGHVAQSISSSMSLLRGVCIGFREKQQREVMRPRTMDSRPTSSAAARPYNTGFFMESHTKKTQKQSF